MHTIARRILVASMLLVVALVAGCRGSVIPIRDLLADPGRYDHREVAVEGTVAEAVGVLGYGAYEVDDGSGKLMVVTRESGAPRTGTRVGVRGEFRSAYTMGDITGAVLIERDRRSF